MSKKILGLISILFLMLFTLSSCKDGKIMIQVETEMVVGETYQIEYKLEKIADNIPLTWKVSDPSVAELDSEELTIKALKAGKFTLSVTAMTGEQASKEITVVDGQQPVTTYTITFELNGGELSNAPKEYDGTEEVKLPTPTKVGYEFKGWYANKELSGTVVEKIAKGETGNKTFYASWEAQAAPETYTISYELNGGKLENGVTTYTKVDEVTLKEPTFTGYKFLGWYDNKELTGSKVENIAKGSEGNKTFYAKWEEVEYTISYELNGGALEGAVTTYTVESQDIELAIPTKEGYTFKGWYANKELSGTAVSKVAAGSTGNKTYYAKWEEVKEAEEKEWTITYNLNGGILVDPVSKYDGTQEIYLVKPLRSGYSFQGWYTTADFSGEAIDEIAKGTKGHIQLYASWRAVSYTISYELNGAEWGTVAHTNYYTIEEKIVLPVLEREGYKFLGWYKTADFSGDEVKEIAKGTTGALKFYAKWELVKYNITYDYAGGKDAQLFDSLDEFIQEFVADFNKYAGVTSVTVANFHQSTSAPVKTAMSKEEMLAKYQWLFKFMLVEMEANVSEDNKADVNYTSTVTLLNGLINGDTKAIGVSADARTTFRHFLHNLLNKNHESGVSTGATVYLPFTVDFSVKENQARFMKAIEEASKAPAYYTCVDAIVLPAPEQYGFIFLGWYLGEEKVEKIETGSIGDIALVAKWQEAVKYTITYELNEGEFPGVYKTIEEFAVAFVADFNKYANSTSVTVANFHNSTSAPIKAAFANKDMLAKYKWFFEFVLAEMKANAEANELTEDANYIESKTCLEGMINGDTAAIGVSANARTAIRHFIHNLLNEDYSTQNSVYKPYAVDFSIPENQAKFMTALAASAEAPIESYTEFEEVLLLTPVREGYRFLGWYLGEEKVEKIALGTTGDLTLVAKWAKEYTITYEVNNGTLKGETTIYTNVDEVKLVAPTKADYIFRGWFENPEFNGSKVEKLAVGTEGNKTFYAKWEETKDYSITYNANGGELVTVDTIQDFAKVFVADFNKYANSTSVTVANFHNSTSAPVKVAFANQEMLAKYKWFFEFVLAEMKANAEANELTEDANYIESKTCLEGMINGDTAAIGVSANARTAIRHFIHNLLNEDYSTQNSVYKPYAVDFSIPENREKFLVVAKANSKPAAVYTELDTVKLPEAKREGYEFKGWNTGEEVIKEIKAGTAGDLILVAEWELVKYTITLDYNGGEAKLIFASIDEFATQFVADFNKYAGVTSVTIANFHSNTSAPIKAAFANKDMLAKYKWFFEYVLEQQIANAEANELTEKTYYKETKTCLEGMINGDTSAIGVSANARTAIRHFIHNLLNKDYSTQNDVYKPYSMDFTKPENQAKFMAAVPEEKTVIEYTVLDSVTLPTITREGYTFLGWFDEETKVETIPAGTKGNMALMAKWKGGKYTITYETDGGTLSAEAPAEYEVGVGIKTLPVPSKEGVHFIAWYIGEQLVTSIPEDYVGNVVLTAKYSEKQYDAKYTVTYDLAGGHFTGGYQTIQEVSADFLKDYNAAAKKAGQLTNATAENFLVDSTASIKLALADKSLLVKWQWLFEHMLEDLKAHNKGSTEAWATDTIRLLPEIIDLNTSTIAGSGDAYANLRTLVRSYLHGMMNLTQGDGVNNPSFASLAPDFSQKEVQDRVLPKQYKLTQEVVGGAELAVPSKHAYKFLGWKNEAGEITKVADSNGKFVAQWEEITPVTAVTITNKITGMDRFTTYQLTWTTEPSEALLKDVRFESSDPTVASVDSNGLITAHKNGTVTIKIISLSLHGHTDEMEIKVTTPGHFEISYDTESYVEIDGTIKLNAAYPKADGTFGDITWESLDTSIATVDAKGNVLGYKAGKVTIRAKLADNASTYIDFVVTVVDPQMSEALAVILQAHESNVYMEDQLFIGDLGSNDGYYADIMGSVSKLLFNDELNIDTTYVDAMKTKYEGQLEARLMESIEFITVHYTAGFAPTSTAKANMEWFTAALSRNATSIHYTTGNDGVFKGMEESYKAAHAGDDGSIDAVGKFEWIKTGVKYDDADLVTGITWTASDDFYYEINGKKTTIKLPMPYNYSSRNTDHILNNDGTVTSKEGYTGDPFTNRPVEEFFNDMGFAVKVVDGEYYMGKTWWCYTQRYCGAICSNGGNANSIGIESCVNQGSDLWYTWQRTAQLVANIMQRNNLDITRVKGHHFFSGKNCPQPMLENDLRIWWEFLELVEAEYAKLTTLKGYMISFTSNSTSVNNKGRVTESFNNSQVVTYKVTISKGGVSETIELASIIEGSYSR